ncbi:hypothetical protein ABQ17_004573 [Salmonella enterica subsp. enterica serovar Oranienburg]|uniref:Uncharacterized protein n=1 Tax=Salmonella enterica TaxID=28901 RepID=A0A3R0Y0T7_SALER|nr:hypothetical protein LFZ12_025035 [Salmonella enterica subsp. enterica serovar Gaminara str. SA20063285]EAB3066475.1 hypothetical protein [Salmonella enterica]EBQ9535355.1 hypothetical protein [Salmonella enterica subsp. enterica serovar Muenster]EBX2454359.1 hypothetical protein [Salmonella enterica subsp. enterica serovar Oranienburg]ECF4688246.1 hypothetical protein [Salmonella enterica subsp. enterica serovar Tennessee]ECG0798477.1 hypothetical protein [Salmonella enterica subsp. diariz
MLLKSVKISLFISGLFSFVPLTPGLSGVVRHPFEHNQVFPVQENYLHRGAVHPPLSRRKRRSPHPLRGVRSQRRMALLFILPLPLLRPVPRSRTFRGLK